MHGSSVVLTLLNTKGGVGKTTTAVNLAAALVQSSRRVLLIDLDSHASASLSLGIRKRDLSPSAADVLVGDKPIRGVIRKSRMDGLDLITGSRALATADAALAKLKTRQAYALKAAIEPLRGMYAFVIIDCPPGFTLLTVNALVAATAFIVPVIPQYLALESLVDLLDAVNRAREDTGAAVIPLGVVLTMVDYRKKAEAEIADMIRNYYKDLVFHTDIPLNARLAEAPSFGQTIFDYSSTSTAAEAYRRLAGEVLERARPAFRR